ncbi:MAG TPA: hypothetical protein VNB06_12855 [Thermoanaerobaculia bacterium]|nr:hypothetical protein [Thermoanaerobaculia bacterium]
MSEPQVPPAPGPPPPPPGGYPPPPQGGGGQAGQPNTVMLVLSYLYILSLVPLLVERDDAEIQWHAKHGLVLLGVDIVVAIAFFAVGIVSGGLGCLLAPVQMLLHLGLLVVRIVCIVKGLRGERFMLPGVSNLASSF